MKLRTESEILSHLDNDFAWRIKEIDVLKKAVRTASGDYERTLIRAGIPLVYAHWEGFIKSAAEGMVCFVSYRNSTYRELAHCFALHGLDAKIRLLTESKKEQVRVTVLEFLLNEIDRKARLPRNKKFNTGGNLSFERFVGIATAVGVDVSRYNTRAIFVDRSLLGQRNNIAHGAWLELTAGGFMDVADGVLSLLRSFKTDLEESIIHNLYVQ